MLAIAGQLAGPNELKFVEEPIGAWGLGSNKS